MIINAMFNEMGMLTTYLLTKITKAYKIRLIAVSVFGWLLHLLLGPYELHAILRMTKNNGLALTYFIRLS